MAVLRFFNSLEVSTLWHNTVLIAKPPACTKTKLFFRLRKLKRLPKHLFAPMALRRDTLKHTKDFFDVDLNYTT